MRKLAGLAVIVLIACAASFFCRSISCWWARCSAAILPSCS